MSSSHDQRLLHAVAQLRDAGLDRTVPRITERHGVHYRLDGRPVVGFCSNDYLGLSEHINVRGAVSGSIGSTGSRLICGDHPETVATEACLADLAGREDAVLFPSGFQLNVGVLPALLREDDEAYSDALNHASLIDGLRLSAARRHVLPHLESPPLPPDADRNGQWWVSETTFSMDGDQASPAPLRHHLDAGGWLYLDEAHSLGLYTGGRGYAAEHGIEPTVFVGTLSKALGCTGGFVAGSRTLCDWVRTRARSFVFSTAIPPALAAAIRSAVTVVRGSEGDLLRGRLRQRRQTLARALDLQSPSPIFPLLVGDNRRALALSVELLEAGFHVQAIRPPTVPQGSARLRLTVSARHDPTDVERLAEQVHRLFAVHGLPVRLAGSHPPSTAACE